MTDTNGSWPFLDPPNTAVFTNTRIIDGVDWVHYVSHDLDDGAWQFHPLQGPANMQEASVIGLAEMLKIEPRIGELADLPLGWHAWRENEGAPWTRAPKPAN